MSSLKIFNYGAGAVGLGLDSCLLKAGASVTILARPATVAALKSFGLVRTGIFGNFRAGTEMFNCYSALDEVPPEIHDIILVTVKTFDSRFTAEDIHGHAALWNEKTKIILCQNGWGNAEILAEYFDAPQIFNARVITGFIRPRPSEVLVTVHADDIHIGSLFGPVPAEIERLCRAISRGGIPCEPSKDIAADLWAKMLYNCALNPLSAILNVSYGELGKQQATREKMNAIIAEVFAVMTAAGHHSHWATAEEYQKTFYSKLLPSTAGHHSSMLQDIKSGRQTEIDSLNGMVIALAEKHNIDVPANRAVYQMIQFLETKNS